MYCVKIYNSINDIEKEKWDLLTENNIFMCYAWLQTFEEATVNSPPAYYIVITEQNEILAASVSYLNKVKTTSIDGILKGRLNDFKVFNFFSFLPVIRCGPIRGYGTHFIFSNELDNDQIAELQNKLIDSIEEVAKDNKSSVCFFNIMDQEMDLMENLKSRGYVRTLGLPLNYMDVEWSSFDGYLSLIRKKFPATSKTIRREINKNIRSGVVIRELIDVENQHKRLYKLVEKNHKKYSSEISVKEDIFLKMKVNFERDSIIYVAEKGGQIIGVIAELKRNDVASLSIIGVDHEMSKDDFTYFNLAFYEPVKNAHKFGIKRIYGGNAFYNMKARRGYKTAKTYIFYKHFDPFLSLLIKFWFWIHNYWMNRKFSTLF